jgi:hypothetical protein
MMSEVRRMNVDHGQLNAARERESNWLHCYWRIPESVDVSWGVTNGVKWLLFQWKHDECWYGDDLLDSYTHEK